MATTADAKITTDHHEIRQWAEEREAQPSCVRGTGGEGDIGMIRLDFPGYTGEESLEHISWDEWFAKFDERGLALLHQETTADGERSNFNKLVSRQTAGEKESGKQGSSSGARKTGGGGRAAKSSRKSVKKTPAKAASKSGGRTAAKKSSAKPSAKKESAGKSSAKKSPAKKTGGKKKAAKKSSRSR